MNVAHPVLKPAFQVKPPDDPARDNGNEKPECKIGGGNLPADKAKQQYQRHLIDHRGCDQEREGYAQRDTG